MRVVVNHKESTNLDESIIFEILDLYSEEGLTERKVFKDAFLSGVIDYHSLVKEAEKILIPWQLFFLNRENFDKQVRHIEEQRKFKVTNKLVSKRKGTGQVTSKRIIDRLIRQQNFLNSVKSYPKNSFCGSLKRLRAPNAARKISGWFEIDQAHFWEMNAKAKALEYLIDKLDSKNINISRGVLTNKLLPHPRVVNNDIYKQTSGFVIRDERIPTIFLPSETNPDEVDGRQIYTLIYLLAVIGLEQFDFLLTKNLTAKSINSSRMSKRIHAITSEFLMPSSQMGELEEGDIYPETIEELSTRFKVTPTALLTTLQIREVISEKKFNELKPEPYKPGLNNPHNGRTPKVSTSVRKFCGKELFDAINESLTNQVLTSIQAQYLIFGAVNKTGFKRYRDELGL